MPDANPGPGGFEKLIQAANRTKPLFEIAGIVAAGFWAFWVFGLTQAPGLKENFKIESSLIWHPLRDDRSCLAEWKVSVTNESKATVKIRKVQRRAWLVDRPEPRSPFSGIKPYDAMKEAEAGSKDGYDPQWYKTAEPFVQTYPPTGERSTHSSGSSKTGRTPIWSCGWTFMAMMPPETCLTSGTIGDHFASSSTRNPLRSSADWRHDRLNSAHCGLGGFPRRPAASF